jgi:hypothetical protein
MSYEQHAYIKSLVGDPEVQHVDQFIRDAHLNTLIKDFEAKIHAAWNQFVQENATIRPSTTGVSADQTISDASRASAQEPSASTAAAWVTGSPPDSPNDTSNVAPSPEPNTRGAEPIPPASANTAAALFTPAAAPLAKKVAAPEYPKAPNLPAVRFTVCNARQNKPFEGEIVCDPNIPGLRLVDVMLPENSGLKVDREHWRITGTPAISGEFKLGLRYAFSNERAQFSYTSGLSLVINADPKTLWKDLPSDRAAPFWKEDAATSFVLGKQARIVAARKRGRSHAHKGTCCDDDYAVLCDDKNGWHAAVVADGAGSAKFSRRGSQVATRAVTSYMKEVFTDERGASLIESIEAFAKLSAHPDTPSDELDQAQQKLRAALFTTLGYAAHTVVRELHAEMKAQEEIITSIKDLSTTLLVGVARKVGSQWFCAAYWVGDGAIAVYRRNQSVQLLGAPDSGEFSGQTHFLDANQVSQDALLRRLRFELVEDMTAFLLMTDGVSDPKFRSDVAMGQTEEWDRLWDELEADVRLTGDEDGVETRLLDWLDFWAQGEYDDRTLAIIY